MNERATTAQLGAAPWFKSSFSAADNECVEVAHTRTQVGIRDSKVTTHDGFVVGTDAFTGFIDGLKDSVNR
ncbi:MULTISPECIES: DUF397 domain-containing protein [Streptomyces]|uniref:DUF397 domain-containing protein n=1 Tax=Streptomyces TaxID=1883 RepID=UPI00099EC23D|nr:DUF397 domain-containing protein [Streptomyces hirsutus]